MKIANTASLLHSRKMSLSITSLICRTCNGTVDTATEITKVYRKSAVLYVLPSIVYDIVYEVL